MQVPVDEWVSLEVTVRGTEVAARAGGGAELHFSDSWAVSGYVGLWTKGDTTAYFRNLAMDSADRES